MKLKIYTGIITCLLLSVLSCTKYVDIKTQGSLIPQETVNYRYLLNNNNIFEQSVMLPDITSDDINIADSAQAASLAASSSYAYYINAYTWQSPIYPNPTDNDFDWNRLYTLIYNCNVIIDEVPGSTNSTDSVKNELIAEALVHRSDAYLTLVNMYAKPYDAGTAGSDFGVPLLLKPLVAGDIARASVAAVYGQIINDLTTAYPLLPRYSNFNFMPSKAAAFALLARANLYMANYPQAGTWADSAMNIQKTLNNLSTLTAATYPKRIVDPEIIFSKQAYQGFGYMPTAIRLSDTLLNVLGTSDLRYTLFTTPASTYSSTLYTGRYFYKERIGNAETRNIGPSVPEMMLIKAEALARSNNVTDALTMVNALRQKRFTTAAYTAVTATTAADALLQVIKERQREFFCRGLRWFDMRRLKNDAAFSRTVTHTFKGTAYTLAPAGNRYVFPIAEYYRSFHPNIVQNP
jgi:hypothetical protein